jgi:catechol 2,3-dioxygenase-like lactoylglutathione lyase family enzyme
MVPAMRYGALAAVVLTIGLGGCRSERPSPLVEAAKANAQHGELSPAIPIFSVRSLRASQAYFRDVLGFKVDWEDGNPPDFGAVSRGHGVFFLCEGCQGNGGAWVMLFAEDVDRLYEEFRERDALIKMPPTNMPWKLREMHVADPDGNVMRFASHGKH